jgi:16S rRNA (guanine(966)-N(2))-methyltransferase RsmD
MRIIAGKWRGSQLKEVDRDKTRPTTDKNKEMLFNILGQYFPSGSVLDLYAGSGALGLEALSRGMTQCYFVDSSFQAINTIRENLIKLKLRENEDIILVKRDVLNFLNQISGKRFNLILADPPYHVEDYDPILSTIAERRLLAKKGTLVIETKNDTQLEEHYLFLQRTRERVAGIAKFTFYTNQEESQ